MANTGTKLTANTTTLCGTSVLCGQGNNPELWVLYSTDALSTGVPSWTTAHQGSVGDVRAVSTSRGRDTELAEIDAGTASITLNNRARGYDPAANALIKPLNQWWIREQFAGETQDIFKGYATSYEQQRPDQKVDAITIVSCVDEFGLLALDALPVTDPPRDTYPEVVTADNPAAYWAMMDAERTSNQVNATPGDNLLGAYATPLLGTPIIGCSEDVAGYINLNSGLTIATAELLQGGSGDVSGLSEFTIEFWFAVSAYPASTTNMVTGPTAGGATTWRFRIGTTGQLILEARDSAGTLFTATTAAAAVPVATGTISDASVFRHVVGTISGGSLMIYVNGAAVATTAWSGSGAFAATIDTGQSLLFGDSGFSGKLYFDEAAFYRQGLSTARATAHYTAGASRGFPRIDTPITRINGILDSITSHAPRNLGSSFSYSMQGTRMTGQQPLPELQAAKDAESGDSILFIGRDGTLRFLWGGYRADSPYNFVQATFDDDGTDLPYVGLTMDYSDSFLFNYWTVTRTGGLTQTAFDTTSIGQYKKRSQGVTDLPLLQDSYAVSIAAAQLAKYKDPMQRITSLRLLTSSPALSEAIFQRDIGDRIEVFGTPPGGGARIDQVLFIQKITTNIGPNGPWSVTWGVSPL